MQKHSIFQQLQNQIQSTGKQSSEEVMTQILKWVSSKISSQNKIKQAKCQKSSSHKYQKSKPQYKKTKKKTIRRRTINKKELKSIVKQKLKIKVIKDILLKKQKKLHIKHELLKGKGLQCENEVEIIPEEQKKQDFDQNIELPPIYEKKALCYSQFSYQIQPIVSKVEAQQFHKERKQKLRSRFESYLRSDHQDQKIDDLNCPICIDILIDPVSTPCGHSYCYKCLDEALLFCSNCPVCRLSIKGLDLINCSHLNKMIEAKCSQYIPDKDILENYHSRREIRKKWRFNRVLNTQQLKVGLIIDVRDTENIWCKGRIDAIYYTNKKITSLLIHYLQWAKLYNQIIQVTSCRLAPQDLYSSRTDIPRYNLISDQQNMRGAVISGNERQSRNNLEDRINNVGELTNLRDFNIQDPIRNFTRINFLRDFMRNSIQNQSEENSQISEQEGFNWQSGNLNSEESSSSEQEQQEQIQSEGSSPIIIIGERRQSSDSENPVSEQSINNIWDLFEDLTHLNHYNNQIQIHEHIQNEDSQQSDSFFTSSASQSQNQRN